MPQALSLRHILIERKDYGFRKDGPAVPDEIEVFFARNLAGV
jgi:hypothetical protein